MAELRLEDIGAILVGLVIVGVAYAGIRVLYEYRAALAALGRALFARHFNRDWWDNFLIWLADQGGSVKDFEEEEEAAPVPRRAPAHMSSQGQRAEHSIAAVPSTGTRPLPTPVPDENDLTYDDAVRRAASIRVGGKWWMSGKKLYSIVGGNHDRFLKIVSDVRGEAPPADVPPSPAVSPIAGRPLPAHVSFHSDNPELEYQAPE